MTRNHALILLAITAVLWSTGGMLIKLVEWNAPAIAGARSIIAALIIVAVYRRRIDYRWSRERIITAIFYAATVFLFVVATKLTTAANAIMLQYTAPLYVALFSRWFLGESTTRWDWLVVLVVVGGMSMFFFENLSLDNVYGITAALGSGFCFAWFVLWMRKQALYEGNTSFIESILWGNILTALMGLPFMINSITMVSPASWVGLLCLGIFQLGLPYILYARSIKHVTAFEAILLPVMEPLLNPIWVFLGTGETPGLWAFMGGLLVLIAVTFRSVYITYLHKPPETLT